MQSNVLNEIIEGSTPITKRNVTNGFYHWQHEHRICLMLATDAESGRLRDKNIIGLNCCKPIPATHDTCTKVTADASMHEVLEPICLLMLTCVFRLTWWQSHRCWVIENRNSIKHCTIWSSLVGIPKFLHVVQN